ncbi:hypothetical protein [Sphingomonas guangdongensis]|uniref:hypothetical protein n=1 Tax=Sphingomonas guangdongensis TaxID=1141890 RepID=UPI001FE904D6|nr:hypothetical protein [Sphingomonas guangdongensis]
MRVALTGLLAVLVLIGIASAVFNLTSKEPAVTAVGAPKPEVVANMTDTPLANTTNEPLAEMGIAPGADGNAQGGY